MDQTIDKLKKQIEAIRNKAAVMAVNINTFQSWKDERTEEIHTQPPAGDGNVMGIGDFWSSQDGYLWLKARVLVPESRIGKRCIGYFDFDSIHEGYASGFESMLYINGQRYQGVDENHKIVNLKSFAGQDTEFCFQLWAGITGGPKYPIYHQLKAAWLGYLDTEVETFGILAQMALEQAVLLPEADARRVILLRALDESMMKVSWHGDQNVWADSVRDASMFLEQTFERYPERAPFQVSCVGHTHIDLAWMWREKHTKEKAMRSFSTAIRLFEEFDDFLFYQSTPQYYEYIRENAPEIYEQIRERIQEGRWEAGGGMWVEADCNLPGGESLVRQIMYGKKYFMDAFGVDTHYLWLPDAFGFPFCLPQLLKKSGIDTFMTSKLSWNKQNRFPHDTFVWRGLDGSQVMGYFLTTPAYGFPTQDWAVTYNGDITPKVLQGTFDLYQEKAWNSEVMMTYGHGDGGGGCTREMVLKIAAMKKVPFAPEVEYCQPGSFFQKLQERLKDEKQLPVWEDELYLEYHRGTYTSQALMKRFNRKLEGRFRNLEYLRVFHHTLHGRPVKEDESLESLWKILLKNQFHDILPGSSIHEVYEDAKRDYEFLDKELTRLGNQLLNVSKEDGYTLWNTGHWEQSCFLEVPLDAHMPGWTTLSGQRLKTAPTIDGQVLVWIPQIEPFGCLAIQRTKKEETAGDIPVLSQVKLDEKQIETNHYFFGWNDRGQLVRLYDKLLEFEIFTDQPGNRLVVYDDKPLLFDAWDIDAFYRERCCEMDFKGACLIENTPLRTIVRFTYTFGSSVLKQDLVLRVGENQIDFVTHVEWKERQCLLKVDFPVNVRTREAVFDTQFGNIRRSTTKNTSVEEAKFEVCAHRFADVSQRDRGVSILNDCKYGYDVHENTIGLTLIKSAIDPDDRADLGTHVFTYAICPHRGSWYEGETQARAFALNHPCVVKPGISLESVQPLFQMDGAFIEVDAVKAAEDGNGLILRFHEYGGGDCPVTIESPYGICAYQECDLMENGISGRVDDTKIHVTAGPYEIKTYRIWMEVECK